MGRVRSLKSLYEDVRDYRDYIKRARPTWKTAQDECRDADLNSRARTIAFDVMMLFELSSSGIDDLKLE